MEYLDKERIERAVMEDRNRPCLYHVAGPCFHPRCLEAHYQTLKAELIKALGGER